MNEIAANRIELTESNASATNSYSRVINWRLLGYGSLVIALCVGWLFRNEQFVDPADGLGYWLGIVGASLMALLLLYPSSKKSKLLQRVGLVKHWFRIHMLFGLVGPLLILYHCNFSVTAINSKVALYSMLAVAGSGIIGRYFYARIHRGLYGKRANIEDLREEIAASIDKRSGLAVILPRFVTELHAVSAELLGHQHTKRISTRTSLVWTVKHFYVKAKLYLTINRELRARAMVSEAVQGNSKELGRSATRYAKTQVGLMRQVAQLSFYERLFSLWHVFHMPLFLLLVVSAIAHVLAVHMY